ncbi:MAG: DUF2785 domain-containing protein [Bdellovibrio sp.]
MISGLNKFKLIMPLLITLCGMKVCADVEINPTIARKNYLKNAVQLQITPRGLEYFDSRLNEILGNLGIKLDEGYFPALNYTAKKTVKIDDFKETNPDAVKMYYQVKDLLTKWFVGFSLNDHLPAIEIGESGYMAEFSRFGIVTDENLMRALGKRDGAVLAIELEVKKMTISTSSVKVWDANNEFLGKAGFEDLTISMNESGGQDLPLKIRLPFYIRMNGDILQFEALTLENNIDKVPLALQYKKLIVPTFAIEINGKKFLLNNEELDRVFTAQAPLILQKIREGLGDFAREKLPEMLNAKARQFLGDAGLEQVQNMVPPGREDTDTRPNFLWGLKLQNINLNDSLKIDLAAYVEDSLNVKSTPLKENGSRGDSTFDLLSPSEYDIALGVDRALINRVLQLSFERKNFEKIQQKDGTFLKLTSAPSIDYVRPPKGSAEKPDEAFIKMHVGVENKPGSIFLKETIVVEFDIIIKLRADKINGGLQMVLDSIDTDSVRIDEKYMTFAGKLVPGKVREGVRNTLSEIGAKWKKEEETIPGNLPLPPKILGLELNINRVIMDLQGRIVMYLNYAKRGVK